MKHKWKCKKCKNSHWLEDFDAYGNKTTGAFCPNPKCKGVRLWKEENKAQPSSIAKFKQKPPKFKRKWKI